MAPEPKFTVQELRLIAAALVQIKHPHYQKAAIEMAKKIADYTAQFDADGNAK